MSCFGGKAEEVSFHVLMNVNDTKVKTDKDSIVLAPFAQSIMQEALHNFAGEEFKSSKLIEKLLSKTVETITEKEKLIMCVTGRFRKFPGAPSGILLNLKVISEEVIRETWAQFLSDNKIVVKNKEQNEQHMKDFAYGYLVAKFLGNFLAIVDSEDAYMSSIKVPINLIIHGSSCVPALILLKQKTSMKYVQTTYVIEEPVLDDWEPENPSDIDDFVANRKLEVRYQLEWLGAHLADEVVNNSPVPNLTVGAQIKKFLRPQIGK